MWIKSSVWGSNETSNRLEIEAYTGTRSQFAAGSFALKAQKLWPSADDGDEEKRPFEMQGADYPYLCGVDDGVF